MINYSDFDSRKRQKILDAVDCISTLQAFLNAVVDLEFDDAPKPNMGFVNIINNIKLELTVAQNELNFWLEDLKYEE